MNEGAVHDVGDRRIQMVEEETVSLTAKGDGCSLDAHAVRAIWTCDLADVLERLGRVKEF